MTQPSASNALIHETSPYLLQHAHNPVHWYPWCEEALQRARSEDKPILLSIGYSACHWCHVMAHESFEDEATAGVMNELFINIKVDREERPDLDRIYQLAQQLLTRRTGGWPLTMFLHPESHIPFYGGTYFPPEKRYGMPGFREVLRQVATFYLQQQAAITQQNLSMMEAFSRMDAADSPAPDKGLTTDPLQQGIDELQHAFDKENGGFGGAPKFPVPMHLQFLLYQQELDATEVPFLDIVLFSLRKMARGGIYDQIGGGFCRYSVDERWSIPHFEKMLYDNGQLLGLYAEAWKQSGDRFFRQICRQTADWMIREMQSPTGGFYSSLDADSEGEEGRFYLWTPEQVMQLLTAEEYAVFSRHSGLDLPPNFEGAWHLFNHRDEAEIAALLHMEEHDVGRLLQRARDRLYATRKDRVWPGRDEKILTAWNALAIKGLVLAGIVCDEPEYIDAAGRALAFIRTRLWQNGRLLATCKDDRAHLNAYLDDYAFLLDALLRLLEAEWTHDRLEFSCQLADCLLEYFMDKENGGFYFTTHDHEKLLHRRKEFLDDAIPSGNGIAAVALARLGHLLGRQDYIDAAQRCLQTAWHGIEQMPSAHNSLLIALQDHYCPPVQIILRGKPGPLGDWQRRCRVHAGLRTRIFTIPDAITDLPGTLTEQRSLADATAYICEGNRCHEPIVSTVALVGYLKRQVRLS